MRAIKIPASPAGRKIRNSIVLFFSLFLTLAVFSQVSAKPTSLVGLGSGKNLQPTTYNLQPNDWLYSKSNNDLSAYLGKKSSSLPTVRYQKDGDYLEFSMTGVSSTTSVSLEIDTKTPNTPTLFYRNILKDIDATYQITNVPFKIKEEIILKSKISNLSADRQDLKSKNLSFLFSAGTSAKPSKQKDGSIAFFGENGEYLFQLDKPFMIDANLNRSEEATIEIISNKTNPNRLTMSVLGQDFGGNNQFFKQLKRFPLFSDLSGWNLFRNFSNFNQNRQAMSVLGNYQIILTADSNWLSTATYPVIIDPTVTHSADAQFNGQKNRVSDSNSSTDATQLESSYPEATKDPYTVLLLHFNEANGTTAGIRDYASTTRVITAIGNASTTSSVTQLGLGNSAAFDGTGDYVSIPGNNDFYFTNTGSLSIDFWVKLNATNRHHGLIGGTTWSGSADTDWMIDWLDSNQLRFQKYSSGPTASIPQDTNWHHIAVTGIGGSFTLYFDGISVATSNISSSWGSQSTNLLIGTGGAHFNNVDSLYLNGNLDSLRILKGRALTPEEIKAAASRRPYAVYTSPVVDATASMAWNTVNWTEGGVNTGNGEQPYNTNSLVAQWDFNDTSGTTLTASSSGSCTTACNGTLTNFAYTASQDQATTTTGWTANNKKWGAGSLMMESAAAADYISITDPASNVLDPNSADLTIETWIKTSDASAEIFSNNNGNGTACASNGYYLGIDANGYPVFYLDTNGATAGCDASTTSQFKINDGNWHKVSVSATRGTSAVIYVDGKSAGSDTSVTSYSAITVTGNAFFGGSAGGLDAILDSTRFYSRALSASEILSNYNAGNIEIQTRTGATSDPNDGTWEAWKPTTGETQLLSMNSDAGNWNAPQQIDGYTKLLLHMDGTDTATTFPNSATTTHTVTAVNQAQVDTAQSKFGGGSGLFDGTGDYLSVPDSNDWNFGTGLFTIDAWIRFNTVPSGGNTGANLFTQAVNDSAFNFLGYNGETTQLTFRSVNATYDTYFSANWSPVVNRWYHIALVRVGTSGTSVDWKYFVDGVGLTTVGYSSNNSGDILDQSTSVTLGGRPTMTHAHYLNGWLDELRISKGIARWTSNFTPPPRAYGSNVKAENETTIKQEGTGSAKLTLGAPQIDGNTVALWHFEETGTTTGTYLYDETANNNDATTTGTTVVDGIFGKGRKFNGTSDYVSVGDSDNWDFGTGNFAVEGWIKENSFVDWAGIVGSFAATTGWGFLNWSGSAVRFRFGSSGATDLSLGTITTGRWYHIAAVRSGNTGYVYLNGQLAGTVDVTAQTINAAQTFVYLGSNTNSGEKFNGILDSFRIYKGRALSADEIAETYRMGANHHLTRQVSAVDLSGANKLAFNVAADRPGTYLEAMLGESDYANYELASSTLALSTNTVLYIKGDEIASSTSIKDSSFSGKAITANGNARTAGGGKIGNAVYFDGAGDYLSIGDTSTFKYLHGAEDTAGFKWTIDFWYKANSFAAIGEFIDNAAETGLNAGISISINTNRALVGYVWNGVTGVANLATPNGVYPNDTVNFHHIVFTYNQSLSSDNFKAYIDGVLVGTVTKTANAPSTANAGYALNIGRHAGNGYFLNGYIDEYRIIKDQVLTPDQIRQAYEYGLRTHPITIDFGATLQSSDLISSATDYNFSLTATTSGLSATTSGLYLGDTIIVKENVGGTESVAQGVVKSINSSTGAVTVASWSGSVPSGGFTVNATVFKWQREYFDISGSLSTHRNAITNLTLRPTNGAEGRTIYLDDFRYNTNYLTASSSSAITSGNNRYLQYRAIFTSTDTYVSPFLSAFNTLYTALANSFPAIIGISGGGFLSF